MRRTQDLGWQSENTRHWWMWGPLVLILVVAAIGLFTDTMSIDDRNSDADSDHAGPLPEKVVQLNKHAYIIRQGATVSPDDICKGGETDAGDGPLSTNRVPDFDGFYTECYVDQTWDNAKKAEGDYDITEAFVKSITKSVWLLVGGIILLTLIYPSIVGVNELLGRRQDKKKAEADRKIKYDGQLAQYRALQESWAKDEIDDKQFDTKLQKLVQNGFEVPDTGVFKT